MQKKIQKKREKGTIDKKKKNQNLATQNSNYWQSLLTQITTENNHFRPASATKSAKHTNNNPYLWSYHPSSETLQQTSLHKHCRKPISIHTTTIAFLRLDLPVHVEVVYTSDLGSKKTRISVRSANHAPLRVTCACRDAPQPSLFPGMHHPRANTALFPPAALLQLQLTSTTRKGQFWTRYVFRIICDMCVVFCHHFFCSE